MRTDLIDSKPLERLRLAQIMATGEHGGAQEHVYALATHLDPARYELTVVALSAGGALERLRNAGVAVALIDEPDEAAATRALATHLSPFAPQIIHNHMFRAEVVGTGAAVLLGQSSGIRPAVISTIHSSRVRNTADWRKLQALDPFTDRLIAVSGAMARKLRAEGRTDIPVSLIYNGVDLRRYDRALPPAPLRAEYGLATEARLVGAVARLAPEKGQRTLIAAWPQVLALIGAAHLLIVGEGEDRVDLEAQAAGLGIAGTVTFTGYRADVPALTAALEVAVLPSYREAQGLSALEAMAMGVPVVASRVGGIPEMIRDGESGLLVPPDDPAALAAAIARLLTDPPYARALAARGYELAHSRFGLEAMVAAVEEVYAQVLAARKTEAVRPRPAPFRGA